ncbi:hypothetical protein J122_24 [Marinobacter excellens LAMA 842]|uniref:Uncharacterized protein n=1 Tax=Marinobacter excellens LAMA 842 TaxID=1306954 RepID=A0A137SHR9_9GAMM|nr:hypothetical protein J122_24 [Marinobacter excellens LAMA 842]
MVHGQPAGLAFGFGARPAGRICFPGNATSTSMCASFRPSLAFKIPGKQILPSVPEL